MLAKRRTNGAQERKKKKMKANNYLAYPVLSLTDDEAAIADSFLDLGQETKTESLSSKLIEANKNISSSGDEIENADSMSPDSNSLPTANDNGLQPEISPVNSAFMPTVGKALSSSSSADNVIASSSSDDITISLIAYTATSSSTSLPSVQQVIPQVSSGSNSANYNVVAQSVSSLMPTVASVNSSVPYGGNYNIVRGAGRGVAANGFYYPYQYSNYVPTYFVRCYDCGRIYNYGGYYDYGMYPPQQFMVPQYPQPQRQLQQLQQPQTVPPPSVPINPNSFFGCSVGQHQNVSGSHLKLGK